MSRFPHLFHLVVWGLCMSVVATSSACAQTKVYVAQEDGNIATLELDRSSGELKLLAQVPCGPPTMHLAVSPDKKFLYASVRREPFQIVTFSIDPKSGELKELGRAPAPGNMCYLSTDLTGRFLFCASYQNSRVAVLAIGEDGTVRPEPVQIVETSPNSHSILASPNNKFVYVPNLGGPRVSAFRFDERTGHLEFSSPPFYLTRESSGPRHQAWHPNQKFWYLTSETDALVYAYTWESQTGVLNEIQRIRGLPGDSQLQNSPPPIADGLPAGGSGPTIRMADIHITPDGKWLYASERASHSLAAFSINAQTGRLTYLKNFETEQSPRGFNIDPSGAYLVAAGQTSHQLASYRIDSATGNLQLLQRLPVGRGPNWVMFVDLP